MYHTLFAHPSVHGCLATSIFWLLEIRLLWAWGHSCLFEMLLSSLSDIYPEVQFLNHMVIVVLVFRGTSALRSAVAARVCIPTHSAQGLPFPHIPASTVIVAGISLGP